MRIDADIAVVGSGFAGSLTALCLRARGKRVVMVERGRHPRFAIGESSTPLANLLIEELAARYELPRVGLFSKWGTWQRARPDVGGGLKRGFSFYFHRPGEPFADNGEHARQLLVAASPHDDIGDTHWYRPDFDHNLVREAEESGAVYLDETELAGIDLEGDGARLHGTRRGQPVRIDASFVVDASGPRGFLVRALRLEAPPLTWLPPTQGLYTHFERVGRWEDLVPSDGAPYPPDLAALHHVFPGGWIWVLRFANGITSAGAALTNRVAAQLEAADGAPAWDRLLAMLPTVREQFGQARAVLPWIHAPRIAFRTKRVCGANWALLPSAAGVIDPLLSTGFPLDAARHRAPARADRTHVAGRGTRRRPWPLRARDARRAGRDRATRRRALREHERRPAVQAPHASLLRRGQLRGNRAAARTPRILRPASCCRRTVALARSCSPARRRPPPLPAGPRERRSSPGSIGPSRRSMSPACATRPAGTGIRSWPRICSRTRRSFRRRRGNSSRCSSAAVSPQEATR